MNGIITIDKAKKMSQIYRQIPENLIDRYKIKEVLYDDINEAFLRFSLPSGGWSIMIDANIEVRKEKFMTVIESKHMVLTMYNAADQFSLVVA